jgi:signal transduction histidine kinase
MNIKKMKWISALVPAVFIVTFEFVRHHFLSIVSMDWGNVIVGGVTGVLFFLYFHGIFGLLENVYRKLQNKKEETAVLEERYRIARELHDSVAQALFFMNIKIMEIESALQERRQPWTEVEEMKEAIKMTDTDIRQHIFALQNIPLKDIDLSSAMQEYAVRYGETSGISVDFNVSGDSNIRLNSRMKDQLFRVFRELLLNIRKHASATQVKITLTEEGQYFSMSIHDNGQGFAIKSLNTNKPSFGLKILAEDVQAMGGKLKLESFPGQGSTALVSLDLKEHIDI